MAVLLLRAALTGELSEEGGKEVVCAVAGPVEKAIEHAGHAYQERLWGGSNEKEGDSSGSASENEDDEDTEDTESDAWKLKKLVERDSDDLYELLEIGHLRWQATDDDLKKAFRKMSLKCHPDKVGAQTEEAAEETEEHFKKILKAYDTLSDRRKRAAYDSVDDVDDSIPNEAEIGDDSFFGVLSRVFDLNARWSTANRVPKLGNESTPYEEVMKFYDFWFAFKSWREFTLDQEYDPDQAEYREERRWMERQNAKKAKAAKKEEMSRLRKLTEMAYKLDPRIRKRREEEKRAKEIAKELKRKKREEAEQAAREEEERAAKEREAQELAEKENAMREKKEREKAKKLVQRARQRVRAATEAAASDSLEVAAAVQYLCANLELDQLEAVADQLESGSPEEAGQKVLEAKRSAAEAKERSLKAQATENNISRNSSGTAKVKWSTEEKSSLSKALAKYPGGTRERWERVAEFVQTKSADECLAMVNKMRAAAQKKSGADVSLDRPKPATDAQKSEHSKNQADDGGPPNTMNFSKRQQASLEAAMKKYGTDLGVNRWLKVSSEVPGKSPEECEARFRELVTFFRSKRGKK